MTTILVTDQGNYLHDTRHPSLHWRRTGRLEWAWDGYWLIHPDRPAWLRVPTACWN